MESRDPEHRPRLVAIELAGGPERCTARAVRTLWRGSTPALDRVGRAGGTALAAALLYARATVRATRGGEDAPLVIALGDAVRRGLPTAARVTVASRAPLTGSFADGQVGGDLARRLASLCDGLWIDGSLAGAGHVLVLRPPVPDDGSAVSVELCRIDALRGLDARATHAALTARFGAVATLAIGPAGEARLPFASLAAGGDPPHFVGRGGLGAVFARTGLKALVVDAPLAEAENDPELARLLASSPRLVARAEGGTLELFGELAARSAEPGAARVAGEIAAAPARRHGCHGCPTPCGVEFQTPRGAQGARFGAARALGLELGLERFDDALLLLAACDHIGADAKETGAALALLALARERGAGARLRGDRAALLALIEGLGRPADERTRDQGLLALGARAAALALGLAGERATASGGALEAGRGLASVLGQCVSPRGADPMRTFPFLAADAGDERAQAALVAPLPLPQGALDPAQPAGKGRLVWWHENWALALDSSGFCAFSAAALLADGCATPGALARRIAPAVHRPDPARSADAASDAEHAAAFLAGGEQVARLIRMTNQAWGEPGEAAFGSAAGAPSGALRALLDRPGLWPEYAALRGIDERGRPTAALVGDFDAERPAPAAAILARIDAEAPVPAARPGERVDPQTRLGRVSLCSSGPLARALGRERVLEIELPAALDAVLAAAASAVGPAARAFLGPERPPPVVYRAGARLAPGDLVLDGDRLELLLVISGG